MKSGCGCLNHDDYPAQLMHMPVAEADYLNDTTRAALNRVLYANVLYYHTTIPYRASDDLFNRKLNYFRKFVPRLVMTFIYD